MKSDITEKIGSFFEKYPEVVAVYLFGSYARGREQRDSDLDLAILLDQTALPRLNKLKRQFTIDLARILRKDLHLVIMNSAGEALIAQIFKYGRCILNQRPELLSRFKMSSYAMIAEFAYYRDQMKKGFINRLLGESH